MARGELAKYRALLFQDKKLEEAKIKKGRLSAEDKAKYEKKIEDIEKALDKFHQDVAGYNKTKAVYVFISISSGMCVCLACCWMMCTYLPYVCMCLNGND